MANDGDAFGPRDARGGKAADVVDTIPALSERLLAARTQPRGLRTLVAGAGPSIDPSAEGVEVARAMARSNKSVLLLDWSLDEGGIAKLLGARIAPGAAELLDGHASFGAVIGRVPGSTAHLIACGKGLASASGRGDLDRLNLLLDTLDETYDYILIAARYNAARDLFETIEGRFDIGVLVGDPPQHARTLLDVDATFLGFDVVDMDVIRLGRGAAATRRASRTTGDKAA